MLTDSNRAVVEEALGRPLGADEEAGYPTLAALPQEVIDAAKKIRNASNLVVVTVYLRHVVPSATLVEVMSFIDDLSANAAIRAPKQRSEGAAETEDSSFQLHELECDDARRRAVSLNALAAAPRADARLLAACERLLADRTITLLSLPYTFGEVRWLAAEAVAALRGMLGRSEPVVIDDVFAPVSAGKVEQLARQAGIPTSPKAGIDGAIETLERIAAAGKLPRRRITREPVAPQP